MTKQFTEIRQWEGVSKELFYSTVKPLNQPAVLKSIVNHWPLVKLAKETPEKAISYLRSLDAGKSMYTIVGEPEINGRFFYNSALDGVNFKRAQASLETVLNQLVSLQDTKHPHAIAIQAASMKENFPDFERENYLPLLDKEILPTMWLGNSATVAAHFDVHDNIACCVLGKRKFTVFPPDQIANLYVGPTLDAPGGVPISMVDLKKPDFEKYPKFKDALDVAQEAVLEPGDAIYIPSPWWHSVESLMPVNMLVNYWWGGLDQGSLSPNHSLLHSMLTIGQLDSAQRESWSHFFDYFVFKKTTDPAAHLPEGVKDIVTDLSPQQRHAVYQFLRERLT
jgi:hypothetical protein